MATIVKSKNGKKFVLQDPAERAKRFGRELNKGFNSFTGKPLTDREIGYRCGVLNERSVSAKIYNKKHGLEGKAKKRH